VGYHPAHHVAAEDVQNHVQVERRLPSAFRSRSMRSEVKGRWTARTPPLVASDAVG
jgi:hypothetical protein